ncbi:MAG: ABC transporter ATP-binding protein [Spirochaetaceae bacterium]|nr:ABC transporter ATP-binding protein [Spirochaetaceae bacterium]
MPLDTLVAVNDLRKRFNLEAGFFAQLGRYVYAVNGLSFTIGENESYGLAGESGCGKTTAARLLVRMYDYEGGTIRYRGADLKAFNKKELTQYRQKVKYVFQDPSRSLNPRMSVYDVLVSGRRWATGGVQTGEKQLKKGAAAILEEVGLSAADLERRPAEFSGGQRQRISIARGLLAEPELLICDEVVSALDVSIQAQILNLLMDIRRRHNLSFLFIAHDLKVACWFCDRIGIMYRGELMEEAPAADLYRTAAHPYTRLLFSSVLNRGNTISSAESTAETAAAPALKGEVRTVLEEIKGCSFADRCPQAAERCFREKPELSESEPGRKLRCFNYGNL